MLFNSSSFLIFFPIVFLLYWLIGGEKFKIQNKLLLAASCFFYASWDVRFLGLLFFSILLDYFSGLKIQKANTFVKKKFWLYLSILINLGFLGFFKYYNFFLDSFIEMFNKFGVEIQASTLQIILPVGISFYTFHGLSYVIDIYKKKIVPERNFIDYALFVSYFPLLVAGPIERATHLLPQLKKKRSFSYSIAVEGLQQILWGLFKKVVIADQCAIIVNDIFCPTNDYYGLTLIFGAILFAIQIYGDFSGYSDIALGISKLLGIELLRNFSYPYFSRSIAEFWRRWHISLSSWFKDYIYIPLGGSKVNKLKQIRNTFIIFVVSGFWHGANWTFIIWGLLNALFILPSIIFTTNRNYIEIVAKNKLFPNFKELSSMLITFALTSIAWIFFRAENVGHAILFLKRIAVGLVKSWVYDKSINYFLWNIGFILPFLIILFFTVEWIGRNNSIPLSSLVKKWPQKLKWSLYLLIIFSVLFYSGKEQQFIYFQF